MDSLFLTLENHIALYIILSRDVPLLKSDIFLRSGFLVGFSVAIFRAAEKSNPRRYACRQELMDSKLLIE